MKLILIISKYLKISSANVIRYQSIEERLFNDPYNEQYLFVEDETARDKSRLVKDFVHKERMRAIEVIKSVQKERIDEMNTYLKSGKALPTTTKGALFSNKFCFLVELAESNPEHKMKVKLLLFLVDFYLESDQIRAIE